MSWKWFSSHRIQSLCVHACRYVQLFSYKYHCLPKDFLNFVWFQSNLVEITDVRATLYGNRNKEEWFLLSVKSMWAQQLMDTKQSAPQLRLLFWVDFHVFYKARTQISNFCTFWVFVTSLLFGLSGFYRVFVNCMY